MTDGPPPGWITADGVVAPAEAIAAYAARGQAVKGVCHTRGCRRRVELDPKPLCGDGLGLLSMGQVKQMWRCQRIDGCGLNFHNEPPLHPLRLDMFIGRPNVRLRVRCGGNGCAFFRIWRIEEMIAGLVKRRQGDGRAEIDKLGPMMTTPCPTCKKAAWIAEVLWIRTDSIGWTQQGERAFDKLEGR